MANVKQPATKREFARQFLLVVIGAFITAYGLEAVLIPNDVIDGGITGISIMSSHLSGIPLGIFLTLLNIPFLYIGYKQMGRTFTILSIVGIISLSVFTSIMHHIPTIIKNDSLLVTISGGFIIGLGIGIVLRNGGALDGSEILAVLLSNKLPLSVGEVIMGFNAVVFGFASFIYGFEGAVSSAIAYFIAIYIIELVQVGLNESKSVIIISDEADAISEAIQFRLGRNSTLLHGEGGYSKAPKKVIYCIITRMEETKLRRIIKEIDESAFVSIGNVAEVRGGNFKKDIH